MVREAARRTIQLRHFEVQLLGGIAMHHGSVIEMQTGEGKTLTATLPAYLNGLKGGGVHVATANPYLARRDAEWMKPVYQLLGMRVGVIQPEMSPDARREAYAADVVYGTGSEFGFDFLKDRLVKRRLRDGYTGYFEEMLRNGPLCDCAMQRELEFVIVDEADSLLIDAANTPLIISGTSTETRNQIAEHFRWSAEVASMFDEEVHYDYDPQKKTVELSAAGRQLVRGLQKPGTTDSLGIFSMYEHVERAIRVARDFLRDREYVVRENEVVIVDEYSGRPAHGLKWQDGIHQAIEAKEGLPVSLPMRSSARVTVQDFFLQYRKLAGMTGTAMDSAAELKKLYRVKVVTIPTNRPISRKRLPDRVFGTRNHKLAAIVAEVREMSSLGRPVLIGTRSIEKSLALSQSLADAGIKHDVLNAHQIAVEASIVAGAGRVGKVTVATNMAGRGTDIKLAHGVADMGGLHVILSEMHDAARIDHQLMGRSGRQGDPGTARQYLALDDEILFLGLGRMDADFLKELGKTHNGDLDFTAWLFYKAQYKIEKRRFNARRALMATEKERRKLKREMGQDAYVD